MTTKTYPNVPGWKGNKSTGRNAAFAIAEDLGRRHKQVVEAFAAYGGPGATCDEVGEVLDLPTYIVRPRASELERLGRLHPVGKRRGRMGHKVTIYSVVRPLDTQAAA